MSTDKLNARRLNSWAHWQTPRSTHDRPAETQLRQSTGKREERALDSMCSPRPWVFTANHWR